MRKAAKTFLIIGMILTFYLIFPIIVGAHAIKRLETARTVDDLRGYGIASIICVSVLGGIFMLCVRQEELDNYHGVSHQSYISAPQVSVTGYDKDNDPTERLKELKALLDDGIIDEATYNEKRKKYLEEL